MFVIYAKSGASRAASKANVTEAIGAGARSPKSPGKEVSHCFWISVGSKGAKCTVNIAGSRVGKVDWGRGRTVECVEIISRSGWSQSLIRGDEVLQNTRSTSACSDHGHQRSACVHTSCVGDFTHFPACPKTFVVSCAFAFSACV